MTTKQANLPVAWAPPDETRLWKKLLRVAASLAFVDDLVAAWYCALDRRTPGYVRAVIWGGIAYFLMPADAVPDWIALLGFADDASVIAGVIGTVGSHIRPEHRAAARARLEALLR
jgi:uncharacterized membrane protein YkvA (DUF1232 family)